MPKYDKSKSPSDKKRSYKSSNNQSAKNSPRKTSDAKHNTERPFRQNRKPNSERSHAKPWGHNRDTGSFGNENRRNEDRPTRRPASSNGSNERSFRPDRKQDSERSYSKPWKNDLDTGSFRDENRRSEDRPTRRPSSPQGSYERSFRPDRKQDSERSYSKPWGDKRQADSFKDAKRSDEGPWERKSVGPNHNASTSFGSNALNRSFSSLNKRNNVSSQRTSSSGRGKAIKKFNPSDFIKKVEEQVIAPAYTSQHSFSDFLIEEQIKENIIKRGYTSPTPIQDQAIPLLLQGKDVIGTANTGTGKTAAFLIPLVNNLLTKKTNRVLIITPTRELAAQIQGELKYFMAETGFSSVLCIGGLSINLQINTLRRDPEFVIGTPGRLKDLEQNNFLNLRRYDSIVLDEVDTMLDMGFINDMKYIISKLPEKRHSLFFSATISQEIKALMNQFLHNPVSVSVKTRQTAENVNQDVIKVDFANKIEVLHDLLIKPEFTKVIIFVRTKRSTDKLAKSLRERGFKIATIHGDKSQAQRRQALELFKNNQIKILLATDVVARGIDIDDVSHVINYDLPQTYEDYIHRIGRTGRAKKVGQALTFIE